jgi:hypothetical protein
MGELLAVVFLYSLSLLETVINYVTLVQAVSQFRPCHSSGLVTVQALSQFKPLITDFSPRKPKIVPWSVHVGLVAKMWH